MNEIEKNKENVASENTCPHEDPIYIRHNDDHVDEIVSSLQPELSDAMENEAVNVDEFLVKIIGSDDPRRDHEDLKLATKNEVIGLQEKNIWKRVHHNDVAPDGIVLGEIFLHTVKNFGTPYKRSKVRLVAQGFDDRDKSYIIYDTAMLRAFSTCLVLS